MTAARCHFHLHIGVLADRQRINPQMAAINALLDRVYAAPPELASRLREMAK